MDLCPPHDFRAGWQDNDHGVIFCRLCGEVRDLEVNLKAPNIHEVAAVFQGGEGDEPRPNKP